MIQQQTQKRYYCSHLGCQHTINDKNKPDFCLWLDLILWCQIVSLDCQILQRLLKRGALNKNQDKYTIDQKLRIQKYLEKYKIVVDFHKKTSNEVKQTVSLKEKLDERLEIFNLKTYYINPFPTLHKLIVVIPEQNQVKTEYFYDYYQQGGVDSGKTRISRSKSRSRQKRRDANNRNNNKDHFPKQTTTNIQSSKIKQSPLPSIWFCSNNKKTQSFFEKQQDN